MPKTRRHKRRQPTRRLRQRQRQRQQQHLGGRLLDKGGYGCIYMPAVRCSGQAPLPNHVTKLMDRREALEEFEMAKKLQAMDPDQRYILYPSAACSLPMDIQAEELAENPLHECTAPIRNPMLLQIPYGGTSLQQFIPRAGDVPRFFEAFEDLLRGVDFLHNKDFAHMDIKPANILIDAVGKKLRTRLIDFGLSFQISDFANFKNITTLSANYYVWPYETRLLDPMFQRANITDSNVERFYNQAVKMFQPEVVPYDLYFSLYGRNIMGATQYREIFDMLSHLPAGDRIGFIAMGTDIYSLGRTLSALWSSITGHYPGKHAESVLFLQRGDRDYTDAYYWTPRLGEAAYRWNANLAETVSIPLYQLVRDMMAPYPFHRSTLPEVLKRYAVLVDSIFQIFRLPQQSATGIAAVVKRSVSVPTPPPTPKTPASSPNP